LVSPAAFMPETQILESLISNVKYVFSGSRSLMTQFLSEFQDHGIHLIFQVEFFLLELYFLQVILLRQVMPVMKFMKLAFILPVLLDQTTEFWIRGYQVILDLLLLHHHQPLLVRMDGFLPREPDLSPP
jgi:hypothetical protein